ncbi:MAG: M48 family metalloprotease [Candidatus Babeliales bacterium]
MKMHINSLSLFLLFSITSLVAMEQPKQPRNKFPFSSWAKKITTPPVARLIPFSVAALPFFQLVCSGILYNTMEQWVDWSRKIDYPEGYENILCEERAIQTFARNEFKENGLPDAESIQVRLLDNVTGYASSFFSDELFVGKRFRDDCVKAGILPSSGVMRQDAEDAQKIKQQIISSLWHEVGHLQSNDSLRWSLVSMMASLASYKSSMAIIRRLPLPSHKLIQATVHGFAAVPVYGCTTLSSNVYKRHREALADEVVPNKRDYLTGSIDFFEKAVQLERRAIKGGYLPDIHNNTLAYYWYAQHPHSQARLDRFKERLALLEEKEQKCQALLESMKPVIEEDRDDQFKGVGEEQ